MKRICVILLILLWPNFALAGEIGKVLAVSGSPTSSGQNGAHKLDAGAIIFEHDKITVGTGNVQIMLSDGTKLVVGSNSSLLIEKFLMRGGSTARKVSINALRGTFRFITGRSAKSAYDIRTANATIGIRGTGFDFSVTKTTLVAVHEGRVKLCGRNRSCVDLNQGCDVGETKRYKNDKTKKLFGTAKAESLTSRLPYAISQNSLSKQFRLNTNACRNVVNLYANEGDHEHSAEPIRPDPPPCVPVYGNGYSSC
jgi:FecR protein